MNHYLVFLEKEWRENLRTNKLLILLCVFLFFALSSPLMMRYMAEILGLLLTGDDAVMLSLFPTTTWQDSYRGFYSDLTFTGAIVIIFMFMGLILREKKSGTADLVFCKGVCPTPFVLAKFTVASLVSLLSLLGAIITAYYTTLILFEEAGRVLHVLAGAGAYGVFLLLAVAWVLFSSTAAKSTAVSAVLGFSGILGLMTLGAIPRVGRFIPTGLMTRNAEITGGFYYPDFAAHLFIALGLTALILFLTIHKLKKQEL